MKTLQSQNSLFQLISTLQLLLLMLIVLDTKAQVVEISTFTQSTIMGLQKGVEIGVFSKGGLGFSTFYQSTEVFSFETGANNYPYYGFAANVPVKQCSGLSFHAQLRGGVVNQEFIIVTPQVETRLDINHWITGAITAGYRAGQPAVGAKIILKISKN